MCEVLFASLISLVVAEKREQWSCLLFRNRKTGLRGVITHGVDWGGCIFTTYIGVANYGAPGHVPPSTSNNVMFFSSSL